MRGLPVRAFFNRGCWYAVEQKPLRAESSNTTHCDYIQIVDTPFNRLLISDMTNQMPTNSRPPQDDRQDELIAAVVALGAIGTILFWGFSRVGPGTPLRATDDAPTTPITALEDGQQPITGQVDGDGGVPLGVTEGSPGGVSQEIDSDLSVSNEESAELGGGVQGSQDTSALGRVGENGLASIDTQTQEDPAEESPSEPSEEPAEDVVGATEPTPDEPVTDEPTPVEELIEGAIPELDEEEVPELAEDVPIEEFSDIDPDYWASPFIEGLRDQDVATGFIDGTFEPDSLISRSQFAAQLYRAFDQGGGSEDLDYTDLPTTHPQYEAIGQVTQTGFMSGYPEGDFRPNSDVSKLEVIIALVSGLNLPAPSDPESVLQRYEDLDEIPEWAFPKVAAATEAGIVINHNQLEVFDPSKSATRAEAAAMLYQALVGLGEASAVESDYIVEP